MYFTDWRRLNKAELASQEEYSEPICYNCAIRGIGKLADWRCQEGYNAAFFCNACAPLNMIFSLKDKLSEFCLNQDDPEIKKIGDALQFKETRTPNRHPFQRAIDSRPPAPEKPKRTRKPKPVKTFTGDKVLLTDPLTGKPEGK